MHEFWESGWNPALISWFLTTAPLEKPSSQWETNSIVGFDLHILMQLIYKYIQYDGNVNIIQIYTNVIYNIMQLIY